MTHIQPNDSQIALINTFKVDPDKAEALIALLDKATETVMKHRVGFISANIHRSLDGGRVANYAQWRTKADFEAMLADPACQEHMKAAADLADSFDPVLYTVSSVHGA
ncbi:antibiotic biosynthesis monooxygenase family protein [Inquilinus sp. CAU 1745]|uniref:antibiotic biosynthesis monooxygenase family protein n=1 Tax=Inquilinus sp. CAU 1745 TaxID=3140369 RepID=UPI00325B27DF